MLRKRIRRTNHQWNLDPKASRLKPPVYFLSFRKIRALRAQRRSFER